MTDNKPERDRVSRKKNKLKERVFKLGQRYSVIFRSVQLGEQLYMPEVNSLAYDTVEVGEELEKLARQANELGMMEKVFKDISRMVHDLHEYSKHLRNISEKYGFPTRTYPNYEPGIRKEQASEVKSKIGELIKGLEGDDETTDPATG